MPVIQTIDLPVLHRLSMCHVPMWYQLLFTPNFSSLAVLKFKLVSVINVVKSVT